jgi:uncharacterized protein YndB with AHSA1/START domain
MNGAQDENPPPVAPAQPTRVFGTKGSKPEPLRLPFWGLYAIAIGALFGLGMRMLFSGDPGGPYAAMMASFIFYAPFAVGALTTYLNERRARSSKTFHAVAGALANMLFVFGTFAMLIEGLICVIVILPMFCVIGAFGGYIMAEICHRKNWPKQALCSFAVLPLVFGGVEQHVETPSRWDAVERSIHIDAPPEAIWRHIHHADAIRPDEVAHGWVFRIGVPLPEAGIIESTPEGLVRRIRMGRNVHFDQVVVASEEARRIVFRYRLYDDSFPPYALDDHVVVGGYYFDIPDTEYRLEPEGEGTRLTIRMGYRVTTMFNWYAEPIARLFLGNLGQTLLDFYRVRSESVISRTSATVGPATTPAG